MLTAAQAIARFGPPEGEIGMVLWDVPPAYEIGVIPKRIYCNRALIGPLAHAFEALIDHDLVSEIKTWDGCFNIRKSKGGNSYSLHAWGLAVDINAAWNQFDHKPTLHPRVVDVFKRAGFDWGGDWAVPDGMHFQLKELPVKVFV